MRSICSYFEMNLIVLHNNFKSTKFLCDCFGSTEAASFFSIYVSWSQIMFTFRLRSRLNFYIFSVEGVNIKKQTFR